MTRIEVEANRPEAARAVTLVDCDIHPVMLPA